MKRSMVFLLSFFLCLGIAGTVTEVYAADTVELSLNLAIPPIHNRWNMAIKPWCDELTKRTGGKVKIMPHFSASLSSMPDNYESVKSGLADMAEYPMGVKPGTFPLFENIFNLNRPSRYITDGTTMIKELKDKNPALSNEFKDTKILMLHCSFPGLFVGTSKKTLATVDDFKGVKINIMGAGVVIEKMKAMGFSVVSMPGADLYMAMETGVVEGTNTDFDLMVSRRFGDVLKHGVSLSTNLMPFYFVMNKKTFNSLPKDVQAVIDEMGGEWGEKLFADFWRSTQLEAWKKWEKDFGGQLHYLSRQDLEKLDAAVEPSINAWVADKEKSGVKAKEMLASYREIENKYSIPWSEVPEKIKK